jgi:flagellar biosynthesis GTPase FlhF
MHKRYLTLALCCGAAAIAGCGSNNSSASGTGAATGAASAAVFSSDLNALCKQGNAAAKSVQNNPAKFEKVIEQYLPKFQALSASGAQQAVYAKFVANIQKEATNLKSGNLQAAVAANNANKTLAKQLKAPACA